MTDIETIKSTDGGDFFAVERPMWAKVCARTSMNEAVAYLILARGAHFGTRDTAWSTDAVERYTGIARPRAKKAIQDLVQSGLLQQKRAGTKPLYHLPTAHEFENPPKPAVTLTDGEQAVLDMIAAAGGPVDVPYTSTAKNGWPRGRPNDVARALVRKGKVQHSASQVLHFEVTPEKVEEAPKPEWIWLPNSLVDGVAGAVAPIEQVRQTQDVVALRLFVDLYFSQSLAMNGGVHWRQVRREYDRHLVGQSGPYNVWGFVRGGRTGFGSATFIAPFLTNTMKTFTRDDGSTYQQDPGWPAFWAALSKLEQLELVQSVAHIIDADTDEGEVIHPYGMLAGEPGENEIAQEAYLAGERLLTSGQREWAADRRLWLLPVLRHIENVQMVGLLRLRHRARTAATAEWLSGAEGWSVWVDRYRDVGQKPASDQGDAISKGDQRGIQGASRVGQGGIKGG
ncbi:hypothetical protein VQ02_10190 [Methylobacterium variabile]|jgi:hypothetical protein|uniref:Uncharacterized protein n=1 Tax=Methylobacterium variabile TaxID=298794 RepID=A0A0J6VJJ6_9HYPH|nr:hypothetical protein [Methylobacterium variabile]KMO39301.1 hypothetical protein VQ02_10190 [Methylobacterium variabile]